MARAVNKIGTHDFLALHGALDPPGEEISIQKRKGVDGLGLWFDGLKGKPFKMRSTVDQADYAAATSTFGDYKDTQGGGLLELTQHDVTALSEGYKVKVLEVKEITRQSVVSYNSSLGLLNPPSKAQLVAEWTLVAVKLP